MTNYGGPLGALGRVGGGEVGRSIGLVWFGGLGLG